MPPPLRSRDNKQRGQSHDGHGQGPARAGPACHCARHCADIMPLGRVEPGLSVCRTVELNSDRSECTCSQVQKKFGCPSFLSPRQTTAAGTHPPSYAMIQASLAIGIWPPFHGNDILLVTNFFYFLGANILHVPPGLLVYSQQEDEKLPPFVTRPVICTWWWE